MNYFEWFRTQEEQARQERILRGILRALANDDDRSTAECPMCCGRGRLEILLGAKDDERA